MQVNFLMNKVFDGWTPNDTRLGGTEEGVVQWARLFAKWGHDVVIWQNGFTGKDQGVIYKNRNDFKPTSDTVINHKSLDITNNGNEWYFTTETDAHIKDLSKFKGVVWPSQWAKDNIKVNNKNVKVVNYGYDPSLVQPGLKIPNSVLYASSPDRGLAALLGIWEDVVRDVPEAQLFVTYGATGPELPNVTYMGNVDEETMNSLYASSEIWCHPCSGGELFGITAVKAQAAHCIPVYFPTMALDETVKMGIACENQLYMKDTLVALMGDPWRKDIYRHHLKNVELPTWESTAKEILELL